MKAALFGRAAVRREASTSHQEIVVCRSKRTPLNLLQEPEKSCGLDAEKRPYWLHELKAVLQDLTTNVLRLCEARGNEAMWLLGDGLGPHV